MRVNPHHYDTMLEAELCPATGRSGTQKKPVAIAAEDVPKEDTFKGLCVVCLEQQVQ